MIIHFLSQSIGFFLELLPSSFYTHTQTHIMANIYTVMLPLVFTQRLKTIYMSNSRLGEKEQSGIVRSLDTGSKLTSVSRDTKHHRGPPEKTRRRRQVLSLNEVAAKVRLTVRVHRPTRRSSLRFPRI